MMEDVYFDEEERLVIKNMIRKAVEAGRTTDLTVKKIEQIIDEETKARHKLERNKLHTCPDCGELLHWNSHFKNYQHLPDSNCAFAMNEYGECVDNNEMRDERNRRAGLTGND